MTPHTLEEQKALLTAEAEGRRVYIATGSSQGEGARKTKNFWNFDMYRYEVERPLMEGWANEYPGEFGNLYATEEGAKEAAASTALRIAVHLREVR